VFEAQAVSGNDSGTHAGRRGCLFAFAAAVSDGQERKLWLVAKSSGSTITKGLDSLPRI
jgi:hypothetical protein